MNCMLVTFQNDIPDTADSFLLSKAHSSGLKHELNPRVFAEKKRSGKFETTKMAEL